MIDNHRRQHSALDRITRITTAKARISAPAVMGSGGAPHGVRRPPIEARFIVSARMTWIPDRASDLGKI